jgi:hypothetical protein
MVVILDLILGGIARVSGITTRAVVNQELAVVE